MSEKTDYFADLGLQPRALLSDADVEQVRPHAIHSVYYTVYYLHSGGLCVQPVEQLLFPALVVPCDAESTPAAATCATVRSHG